MKACASVESPDGQVRGRHAIPVRLPYRLDLTVNVLRRLSTNLVDVLTYDRAYVRIFGDPVKPIVVRVKQLGPGTLTADIQGPARAHERVLALVARILGVDVDLTRFYDAASSIPWLHPLSLRMRGVKPPRYPTLWEACANAIVFQQISLAAASGIMGRLIVALEEPTTVGGVELYRFPGVAQVQQTQDAVLRRAGLSAGKLATLRRVGNALARGTLSEAMLEERPSPDAAALLQRIKGIGPWTAALILLRGLGRLDAFPPNDTSVARNLALIGGSVPLDLEAALAVLGPERGMLYYHLLLARLEARGDLAPLS
jgi:DNA-3-methyladenine glycosylase II